MAAYLQSIVQKVRKLVQGATEEVGGSSHPYFEKG